MNTAATKPCVRCRGTGNEPEEGRQFGKVKWFSDEKGWGFVVREDGVELFAHYSNIDAEPKESRRFLEVGQFVEFDVDEGPKGLMATRIRVLSDR